MPKLSDLLNNINKKKENQNINNKFTDENGNLNNLKNPFIKASKSIEESENEENKEKDISSGEDIRDCKNKESNFIIKKKRGKYKERNPY